MSGSNSAPSIMEFSMDLNDQTEPEVLPTGDYPAEVVEAALRVSNTTGNTYLGLKFRIAPEAFPVDFTDGDVDGVDVNYNRLVVAPETAQNRWRLKKGLNSLGAKVGKTLDPQELIGLSCTLHVEQGEYEGEKQLQVRKLLSA